LSPLTLWTYLNYGRPKKPSHDGKLLTHLATCTTIKGEAGGGVKEVRTRLQAQTEAENRTNDTTVVKSNAQWDTPPPDDDRVVYNQQHQRHQSNGGPMPAKGIGTPTTATNLEPDFELILTCTEKPGRTRHTKGRKCPNIATIIT